MRIPRLFLPDDGWQEVVGQVVRAAEVIVVQVEELTPGVLWELDCIRTHGRSPSTLVVLARPVGDERDRAVREGLKFFATLERGGVPATKEAKELAGFERLLSEDEIPQAGLAATPLFADLLDDLKTVAALDAEGRLRRLAGL